MTETPYFSIAPPRPPPALSPSSFCYCVCVLCEYVLSVWGFGDSLLPIVLSFLLHSRSASCGASCYEAESRRETEVRKELEKEEMMLQVGESLIWAQKLRKSTKALQSQQLCVLPCVPMANSLQGPAYLQSTVQERVCPLDFDVCECDGDVIVIL